MPGWHEQHKHKDMINTETKHDSPLELVEIKQEWFFVSSFVLLLAYAWTMILGPDYMKASWPG